jgi:hypothetical protein
MSRKGTNGRKSPKENGPKKTAPGPAIYRVTLYRDGSSVMDQTFNTNEVEAEDIGQLAGGSIAEAIQLEEAKWRRL